MYMYCFYPAIKFYPWKSCKIYAKKFETMTFEIISTTRTRGSTLKLVTLALFTMLMRFICTVDVKAEVNTFIFSCIENVLIWLFLKLVQINLIFSGNVHVLYINYVTFHRMSM